MGMGISTVRTINNKLEDICCVKLILKKLMSNTSCSLQNDLTGEHSCIMLKALNEEEEEEEAEGEEQKPKETWLLEYWKGGHISILCPQG